MPPLQVSDSPTIGRQPRRRSSATVPYGVLHSNKLGAIEPQLEEPTGICLYAHDTIVTMNETDMSVLMADHHKLAPNCIGVRGVRAAGRSSGRRRSSVVGDGHNHVPTRAESDSVFLNWFGCTESPCIIS